MGKYCSYEEKQALISKLISAVETVQGKMISSSTNRDYALIFEEVLTNAGIFNNRNLIDLDEYISYTLWSRDDIRGELVELGYEDSEENIDRVIDSGLLECLGDCLDDDWNTIHYAIKESLGYREEREEF